MWFKSPELALFGHWTLDQYLVNDVDSTHCSNVLSYIEQGISFGNSKDKDFTFPSAVNYQGSWSLSSDKKNITINSFGAPAVVYPAYGIQKNIFVVYGFQTANGLVWKIEKLTEKQFWLSTTYNSLSYYIRFKR